MLALAPADPPDLVVGDEALIGPNPILVETSANSPRQRHQVAEVHEHHRLAKRLSMDDEDFERDQHAGRHAKGKRQSVIRWRRAAPDEDRAMPALAKPHQLEHQTRVRDEKSGAQQQQRPGDEIHAATDDVHAAILRNFRAACGEPPGLAS